MHLHISQRSLDGCHGGGRLGTATKLHGDSRLDDRAGAVYAAAFAAHDLDQVDLRSPLLPALHQAERLLVDAVDRKDADAGR